MQVTRAPDIMSGMESSVKVAVGQEATLLCKADGFPKPEITWERDNEEILFTKGFTFR